jgi:hypothetical protein
MKREKCPILEFDDAQAAKIEPSFSHKKMEGYEYCVITFFREVLEDMEKEGRIKVVNFFMAASINRFGVRCKARLCRVHWV